jgi:3-deoxy-manno-octulosonate cytidylyltransferase (CMP-KDO synthetase)
MDIGGKPLIVRAWETALAAGIGPVVVATDAPEIASVIRASGGMAVMTSSKCQCGTDRVGEALAELDPERRHQTVVNMQGDHPVLPPGALSAAIDLLQHRETDIGTLAVVATETEADDPNAVKLIGAQIDRRRLRALYFSRAHAPWGSGPLLKHIGVYAFRRSAIERFVALPPSLLEQREKLEQLRALEAGMRIDAVMLDKDAPSVDTGRDLSAATAAAIAQDNS